MKKVIVINGRGTAGKDTLCKFVGKHYRVINVSAITPIKEAAALIGWNGEKTEAARKFLADMKQLSVQYNDYPTRYLLEQYRTFMDTDAQVLFVHIREADQIAHFVASVPTKVLTLLVKRSGCDVRLGNDADDNVEEYSYDYTYFNDCPLEKAEEDFMAFFHEMN